MQGSKSLSCLVNVEPLSQQKKKHFTTKGKQVWRDSTFFLEKAEAQIRVCNHSNLLINWAMGEFRSLWMHQFKSASTPPLHTHFLQYLWTHTQWKQPTQTSNDDDCSYQSQSTLYKPVFYRSASRNVGMCLTSHFSNRGRLKHDYIP